MNAHPNFKSELRPLPMRVSQLQFERLHQARARDGLSVQEHVRRALDLYLKQIEREAAKVPQAPAPAAPELPAAELPGFISGQPLRQDASFLPPRKGPPKVRQR